MNQVTQQEKLGAQVALSSSDAGFAVTPQTLNDIVEFAKFMSYSKAGIPAYLRDNAPDCAAITMQALKWGFDPFSVAQKSYKVKDVLAYEAQLIAAVINSRSGIKGRLRYHFEGEGDDLTCTVTGMLDGEICPYTSPRVGNITTKNSPLWKTDPQQQLGYYSARNWARRHCPEVILGVYDRDEAEEFRGPDNARDVTPTPSVMQRLRAAQEAPQQPSDDREGFDAAFVHSETETALTGEILDNTNTDEPAPHSSVDAGTQPVEGETDTQSPTASPSNDTERDILIRFAAEMLPMAANAKTEAWKEVEKGWSEGEMKTLSEDGKAKAKSISQSIRAIANGNVSLSSAAEFHAEVLDCKTSDLGGVDG